MLPARDGVQLAATLFEPATPNGAAILVNSGTGIPRQFYGAFASHLARRGFAVLTYDYRAIGGSEAPPAATVEQWGAVDQASMIEHLARLRPGAALGMVGHSFGGQVLGLADNISERRSRGADLQPERPLAALAAGPPPAAHAGAVVAADPGPHRRDRALPRLVDRHGKPARQHCPQLGALGPLAPLCLRRPRPAAQAAQRRRALPDPLDKLLRRSRRAVRARSRRCAPIIPRRRSNAAIWRPSISVPTAIGHFGFFRKSMPREAWDDLAAWFEGVCWERATPVARLLSRRRRSRHWSDAPPAGRLASDTEGGRMQDRHIGDVRVTRIEEQMGPGFPAKDFFPEFDADTFAAERPLAGAELLPAGERPADRVDPFLAAAHRQAHDPGRCLQRQSQAAPRHAALRHAEHQVSRSSARGGRRSPRRSTS